MTRSAGMRGLACFGVGAHRRERVAHGGEIDHAGDAGEILQQDARGHEVDLFGMGPPTPRAT